VALQSHDSLAPSSSAQTNVLAGEVTLPNESPRPESVANIGPTTLTSRLRSFTRQHLRVLQMLCLRMSFTTLLM